MKIISCLAKELLVSQEGLYIMYLGIKVWHLLGRLGEQLTIASVHTLLTSVTNLPYFLILTFWSRNFTFKF